MTEIWKAIPGFEGCYEASTCGRIRSLDRWVEYAATDRQVACRRRRKGKVLSLVVSGKNKHYLAVSLSDAEQRCYGSLLVHRLILLTFTGPCPQGEEGIHIDGDSMNNHIENLRYGTHAENCQDRTRHGRHRFLPSEIPAIRQRIASAPRGGRAALAKELGVSTHLLERIASRKAYGWVA